MPYFVDPAAGDLAFEDVPITAIEGTILAPVNIRAEDAYLIVIHNPSLTDTVTATTASSMNGTDHWVAELNDEFNSIGPGVTRRMLIPADRLHVRVTGNFGLGPGNINVATAKLRTAIRRG